MKYKENKHNMRVWKEQIFGILLWSYYWNVNDSFSFSTIYSHSEVLESVLLEVNSVSGLELGWHNLQRCSNKSLCTVVHPDADVYCHHSDMKFFPYLASPWPKSGYLFIQNPSYVASSAWPPSKWASGRRDEGDQRGQSVKLKERDWTRLVPLTLNLDNEKCVTWAQTRIKAEEKYRQIAGYSKKIN